MIAVTPRRVGSSEPNATNPVSCRASPGESKLRDGTCRQDISLNVSGGRDGRQARRAEARHQRNRITPRRRAVWLRGEICDSFAAAVGTRNDPMMPELAARVTVFGTAVRAATAFVVASALLLQLVAMPPLAMRMLSGFNLGGWPVAFCSSGSAQPTSGPAHQPRLPASPHDHDGCPLCQNHSVPLAPIAVWMVTIAVIRSRRWLHCGRLITPVAIAAFRLYSARAPPAEA